MANGRFNNKAALFRWLLGPLVCVCLAFSAGGARASGDSVIAEQTESFLGDRSSVGALVGGILAGASFATPLAPLGGTVIGFFVGKSTEFSKEDDVSRYSRRSFAPVGAGTSSDVGVLALSGGAEAVSDSLVVARHADGSDSVGASTSGVSANPSPGVSGGSHTAPEYERVSAEVGSNDEPINLIITKEVGGRQKQLDELAATIRAEQNRPEFIPSRRCPERDAPRYRKTLAVLGFTVEHPEQAVMGQLGEIGASVSKIIYQRFREGGKVLPFSAPRWQLYANLESAPTVQGVTSNRLSKYSAVSRETGAQFVLSGVVRSVAVRDGGAWDTSTYSKTKRALFGANTQRDFVVDVVVNDGYTGRVVLEKRYEANGAWEPDRYETVVFGSPQFKKTGYGQSVDKLLSEISSEVSESLACQPMLVPILDVNGKDMVLDVGTNSGLLPGDKMKVVRAQSSWTNLDAPPRLVDTGVELHIHSLSLDKAQAWMPAHGHAINVHRGDYAVIY